MANPLGPGCVTFEVDVYDEMILRSPEKSGWGRFFGRIIAFLPAAALLFTSCSSRVTGKSAPASRLLGYVDSPQTSKDS